MPALTGSAPPKQVLLCGLVDIRAFDRAKHDGVVVVHRGKADRAIVVTGGEEESVWSPGETGHGRTTFGKERLVRIVAPAGSSGRQDKLPTPLRLLRCEVPQAHSSLVRNEYKVQVQRMRLDVGANWAIRWQERMASAELKLDLVCALIVTYICRREGASGTPLRRSSSSCSSQRFGMRA